MLGGGGGVGLQYRVAMGVSPGDRGSDGGRLLWGKPEKPRTVQQELEITADRNGGIR